MFLEVIKADYLDGYRVKLLYSMRSVSVFLLIFIGFFPLQAQTNWGRVITGVAKAGQAMTITDEDLAQVVRQQIEEMDKQNKVCGANSKYTKRLNRLTKDMKDAGGIELNFKVYQTTQYNAFACPDGTRHRLMTMDMTS